MIDLLDADLVRDPFGVYGRLRERSPLARGVLPGAGPLWIVTRYEDVRLVLNDRRFVGDVRSVPGADATDLQEQFLLAAGLAPEDLEHVRPTMSDLDGAAHAALRGAVSRAFTARRVSALRPRVERLAADLLDALPRGEVVDLLAEFAHPLPITVICELIGVPERDRPRWREWSAALAPGGGPAMAAAVRAMAGNARELVERRRAEPADDLVTDLVLAGDQLGEAQVISTVFSLVVAGHETTANLIANGTAALLTHPDQLALLRADPGLLPRAVQELMRWCGPALGTRMRYATEDVEIGGGVVRRGEAVMPVLGAANRDPRVFAEPDRLDVTRDAARPHVGFGHGPHHCLGAALAALEGEVAFGALLRDRPGLALAVAPEDLRRGANPGTRHLAELPVRW
ncbi:cytochrome P450 family protein [Umezawaea beigongshangensis]|uniref:cytochrome P450 family protein n=1 Tax=Umezawaea beigongshangensis TaxID=2780383 RepID=UPI0027DCBDBB|nr:cytochrome P450 [Umezawaea beigongshangensis]